MQEQNSTIPPLLFKCPPSNLYGVKNRLIKEDKIKNSSKKCTSTLIIARKPFKTRNSAEYNHSCPGQAKNDSRHQNDSQTDSCT